MLDEMPNAAFLEWMAYYEVAPWGAERDALHMGILASATVSPYCKKHDTPNPSDFMPDFLKKEKPRQTEQEMRNMFNIAAAAFNQVSKKKAGA